MGTYEFLDSTEKWMNEDNEDLRNMFGTLSRSVLSLYMSISGGNDWELYYTALSKLPLFYTALYLGFVTFSIFAVVNIITGIFVESAVQSSHNDKQVLVHEQMEKKNEYIQRMSEMFQEMDSDGSGQISQDEFERHLRTEKVLAYFKAMELDVADAHMLFALLDYDGSKDISIAEFRQGCYKLQGRARALDSAIMMFEVRWLKEAVMRVLERVDLLDGKAPRPKTGSPPRMPRASELTSPRIKAPPGAAGHVKSCYEDLPRREGSGNDLREAANAAEKPRKSDADAVEVLEEVLDIR
jgi:hypothetical protein